MDKRRESEEDTILAENLVNIYLDKNSLHIQTFSSLKSKIASRSILPAVKRDSKRSKLIVMCRMYTIDHNKVNKFISKWLSQML